MPHLNKLQSKFGDQGLSIIGVASESESLTTPWIEKTGATYAYAFDSSKALMQAVGAKGFPSAVLINASGEIVYAGHPARITDDIVASAVSGALSKPLFEWPSELSKAAKLASKDKLGAAIAAIEKKGDGFGEYAAALISTATQQLNAVKAAAEGSDWLYVETQGKALAESLSGRPEVAEIEALLAELKGDKAAKAVLKAQKSLAKMFVKPISKKMAPKLADKARKIAEEFPGTGAQRDAERAIAKLKGLSKR